MAKKLYFADTLVSVKYNKTLKTLPLSLYESIQLLMRVLSRAVYFIQTGGSALSNTYCTVTTCCQTTTSITGNY